MTGDALLSANARRRGRPARADVYARLDAGVAELRQRLGGLPAPADAVGIWDDIWVRDAHNSTAIEGNTLLRHQVDELLHTGRAVGNHQLAEYLEVTGYAQAARWVYGQALNPGDEPPRPLLTLTEIRQVHRLTMGPVWDVAPHPHATPQEAPGSFREHDIAPFPGGMVPPSHPLVPAMMRTGWTRSRRCPSRPTDMSWNASPAPTLSSNVSTRSWTATAGPVACCSTCC